MTPAEARARFEEIVDEHGHEDSPFCRLFDALLDVVEDQAAELERTNAALARVLDVVSAGAFGDTIPETWTDRR